MCLWSSCSCELGYFSEIILTIQLVIQSTLPFSHFNFLMSAIPYCYFVLSLDVAPNKTGSMIMIRKEAAYFSCVYFPLTCGIFTGHLIKDVPKWLVSSSTSFSTLSLSFYVSSDLVSRDLSWHMFHLELQNARHIIWRNIPVMTAPVKVIRKRSHLRLSSHCSFHLPLTALKNELFLLHNAAADWMFTLKQKLM